MGYSRSLGLELAEKALGRGFAMRTVCVYSIYPRESTRNY